MNPRENYTTDPDGNPQLPMAEVAHATQPPGLAVRIEWVDRQDGLSGIETAILVRMALVASTGSYWQSQATLSELTRFSRRTVQRALQKLVARRLLSIRTRLRAPNVYTPLWSTLEHSSLLRQRDAIGVRQSDAVVRQRDAIKGVRVTHPSLDKNSEKRKEEIRGCLTRSDSRTPESEQESDAPSAAAGQVWEAVLAQLKDCVPGPSYATWLQDTAGHSFSHSGFMVSTPNSFVSEMLEWRMYSVISQAVEAVVGQEVELRFIAREVARR